MSSDSVPLALPLSRLTTGDCEATTLYRELRKPLLRYLVCLGFRWMRRRTWFRMLSWVCIGTYPQEGRRRTLGAGCFGLRTIRPEIARTAIAGVSQHRLML